MSAELTREERHIQADSSIFYTMVGMLNCADQYAEYMIQRLKADDAKYLRNQMGKNIDRHRDFKKFIVKDLKPSEGKDWDKDWRRDYMHLATILKVWAEGDDIRRAILERFALELEAGNITIENRETPENEQHTTAA